MSKKVVALLFGGQSTEHEVSILSAVNVISSLSCGEYIIFPIFITKTGKWFLYEGAIENIKDIQIEKIGTEVVLSPDTSHGGLIRIVGDKMKKIEVDVVFPILHGKNGEDGTVQGLCELTGIPYVGCGVMASAVCMDKAITKIIAEKIGLKQSAYRVYYKSALEEIDVLVKEVRYKIGYPCFVKPANAGSSVGISKASNKDELIKAVNAAFEFDRKIIIEKGIVGRELECAILGYNEPKASCIGEIVTEADFYDYDSKYLSDNSKTIINPELPEGIADEIKKQALKIFTAVDGSGMARVDFFLEEGTNKIIFNEINTIPGYTNISMYHKLWKESGVEPTKLVDTLIQDAFERFFDK